MTLSDHDALLTAGEPGNDNTCPRCGNLKAPGDLLCANCHLDLRILHALEDRCGEPITRAELEALTGLPDRANRRAIERLRQGVGEEPAVHIVASSKAAGYRIAQDTAEQLDLEAYYRGVALTMLVTVRALRRARQKATVTEQEAEGPVEFVRATGQGVLIA